MRNDSSALRVLALVSAVLDFPARLAACRTWGHHSNKAHVPLDRFCFYCVVPRAVSQARRFIETEQKEGVPNFVWCFQLFLRQVFTVCHHVHGIAEAKVLLTARRREPVISDKAFPDGFSDC